jgi:hypothetical protein
MFVVVPVVFEAGLTRLFEVFTQIEMRLCENDEIYYNVGDYEKAPITYNSSRRKRTFQYSAFILWEGVNYRK